MAVLALGGGGYWLINLKAESPSGCADETNLRSSTGAGKSVTLDVHNNTDQEKALFWINYDGKRAPYGTIGPKQSVKQDTFVGHVWMITNVAGQCEKVIVPAEEKEVRISVP